MLKEITDDVVYGLVGLKPGPPLATNLDIAAIVRGSDPVASLMFQKEGACSNIEGVDDPGIA
jgi:hypothetical protein